MPEAPDSRDMSVALTPNTRRKLRKKPAESGAQPLRSGLLAVPLTVHPKRVRLPGRRAEGQPGRSVPSTRVGIQDARHGIRRAGVLAHLGPSAIYGDHNESAPPRKGFVDDRRNVPAKRRQRSLDFGSRKPTRGGWTRLRSTLGTAFPKVTTAAPARERCPRRAGDHGKRHVNHGGRRSNRAIGLAAVRDPADATDASGACVGPASRGECPLSTGLGGASRRACTPAPTVGQLATVSPYDFVLDRAGCACSGQCPYGA